MANKIIEVGFKKQIQPVRIGGLDFEIKLGEKNRKKYLAVLPEMEQKLSDYEKAITEASKNNDLETIEKASEKVIVTVKDCIDLILGAGSFDKLYVAAGEDVDVVLEAFLAVIDQYKKLQEQTKAKAYIDGKKK